MSQHNDVKATAVSPYAGPPCLTTTTGERRAPGAAAPARRRSRARVRWLWLAGLLLAMLVGTPSAFAIITCDSAEGCGGGGNTCTEACGNGDCDRPTSGVDKDYDGVMDPLEYDLAHRFFPNIWLQAFSDLEASYLYQHKPLPYMVTPYQGGASCDEEYECLEIRYGIAYFEDFGLPLPICVPFACPPVVGDHVGDSEFYAVLVQRTTPYSTAKTDPASWQLIRDFTAAHQGATGDSSRVGVYGPSPSPSPSSCSPDWGQYADTPLSSRATVFAAQRKHALYHSVFECLFGALGTDRCLSNLYNMRSYQAANLLQNIGSPTYHTSFDWTIQDPDGCSYSIWSGAQFGESSPYDEKFLNHIDWCLPLRAVPTDQYITITPVVLPVGTSGIDYGQTFDPTGSTGTVEWSISDGTLPSGVTLDTRSGALVGTPTDPGISTFTVRAANSTSLGERTYTLVVTGTSTTDLLAYPNPVEAGQPLTLEAEVRTQNGDIPTGTVYFGMSNFSTEKGEILGRATLEGGVAQLTIPAPAAGIRGETVEYVISAIYSSDGYFDPSSADLSLTVHAESAPIE